LCLIFFFLCFPHLPPFFLSFFLFSFFLFFISIWCYLICSSFNIFKWVNFLIFRNALWWNWRELKLFWFRYNTVNTCFIFLTFGLLFDKFLILFGRWMFIVCFLRLINLLWLILFLISKVHLLFKIKDTTHTFSLTTKIAKSSLAL
jgi:hypothetical protein